MRRMMPFVLLVFVACTGLWKPAQAMPACTDLPLLFRAFELQHYSVKQVDAQVQQRAVKQFIEHLDPAKNLLLQADVQRLENELSGVFEAIRQGQCASLASSYKVVQERAQADLEMVRKMMAEPFKIDESVVLVVDAEKRSYAKTAAERQKRVRDMVHFQMSNYLTAGLKPAKAKEQLVHRYELVVKRLDDRQRDGKLPTVFAQAFAMALDPHSAFMSADMLVDFQIQMNLSLEGIGAVLRGQDGFTIIESLVPGGQAEKSGKLRPKDKIIAVAQPNEPAVPVVDMELSDVVKMIRGKKGTQVTLTVLREGENTRTFDITIVRDKIDIKSQAAKLEYETFERDGRQVKIGILELPSFYGGSEEGRSSYRDVKNLLAEARKAGVDGIVLDLSQNGGGLLDEAVHIGGLFIQKGAVVATKDTRGHVQVLTDDDPSVAYTGPLAVLVSPSSASASEILAGFLQDYRRAVVLGGKRTFGKGSVQQLTPLSENLGALKVTTAMFFLPQGASTQADGVRSDIHIPSIWDGYDIGEHKLDHHLPAQRIPPFLSKEANSTLASKRWKPVQAGLIKTLASRSQQRVAAEPQFKKIFAEIQEMKQNDGVIKLKKIRERAEEGLEDADSEQSKALHQVVKQEAAAIAADLAKLQG